MQNLVVHTLLGCTTNAGGSNINSDLSCRVYVNYSSYLRAFRYNHADQITKFVSKSIL